MQCHEEYHCLRGDIWWRSGGRALAARTGADQHLISHAAVGGRNAGEERRGERAGDSGKHDGYEPIVLEISVLFRAAAVEIWISLLEPQDRMAFLQGVEAQSEKLRLRRVGVAGKLPSDVNGRAARDEIQHGGRDEFVGEDQSRRFDGAVGG